MDILGYIIAHGIVKWLDGGAERKLKKQLHESRFEQSKELLSKEYQLRKEQDKQRLNNSTIRFHEERNSEKSGISYSQGGFKKKVFHKNALEKKNRPFVIFDCKIREYHVTKGSRPFKNPLIELSSSFENQNKEFLDGIVHTTNHFSHFLSEGSVRAFYNEEFQNDSAIIIYSFDDGNYLNINAIHRGMFFEDFVFDEFGNPYMIGDKIHNVNLAKLRRSFFMFENMKLKDSKSQMQKFEEDFQHVINFISNVTIQALLDSYFSITQPNYKAVAGLLIESYEEELSQLGLLNDTFKKAIEDHRHGFFEQTKYIQKKRLLSQIKSIRKNT